MHRRRETPSTLTATTQNRGAVYLPSRSRAILLPGAAAATTFSIRNLQDVPRIVGKSSLSASRGPKAHVYTLQLQAKIAGQGGAHGTSFCSHFLVDPQ